MKIKLSYLLVNQLPLYHLVLDIHPPVIVPLMILSFCIIKYQCISPLKLWVLFKCTQYNF